MIEELFQEFQNLPEIQNQINTTIDIFNHANITTQRAITIELIQKERLYAHCVEVAFKVMETYEDDIEKLSNENKYLNNELNKYQNC